MSFMPSRRATLTTFLGSGVFMLAATFTKQVTAQPRRQIEMVAKRFNFSPAEIHIKVGEPVVLAIRSMDFVHGLNIPDLKIRSDLMPGRVTLVEVMAGKPGKIEFVCDNFCGDDHEEMHGQIIVSA
jgi:cytochrome c oxidase subunit II